MTRDTPFEEVVPPSEFNRGADQEIPDHSETNGKHLKIARAGSRDATMPDSGR